MNELFVTVNGNETMDKQHVGSFKFSFDAEDAIEEIATKLFKQYEDAQMLTFQITKNGKDQFFTKKRPATGAFANTRIGKNTFLLLELDKMKVELIDESKAMDVVKEIEDNNMTIKQWVKENSTKLQAF